MADITFRVPSKAVQYGYIELPVSVEEGASPEALASVYVNFVYAFQKEEQAAIKRLLDAPQAASQPVTEEQAKRYLDEGLGGTTELSDDGQNEDVKPWDKPAPEVKKPWEQESKPSVVDALGDGW